MLPHYHYKAFQRERHDGWFVVSSLAPMRRYGGLFVAVFG